ncbi:hypothetical protein E8E11_003088 [Didymella keratinophila]|nr:hypothetical protein E8E11_003088 [Didymella keratinophila]
MVLEMSAPNPFAFTGRKIPQSSSCNASSRAREASLEQKIASLERNLQEANDANGVARATAAANKAANDKVRDAERETQRAQMAERIALNALDDLRCQLKMAESANAELEEKVRLQQEQEHSTMENGKLQVEPETSQDSPANASAAAEDENHVHAECQRERAELVTRFQELCNATGQQLAAKIAAFDAELKDSREELEELKAELKEQAEQKEKTQGEAQNINNKYRVLEVKYKELTDDFDKEVEARLEETNKTNKDLQDQLQKLKLANDRTQEFRHILEKYENELTEAKEETVKYKAEVEQQKKEENHLKEEHESILAKLHAEEKERETIAVERDELKNRLEKTEVTTQEIVQKRDDLQKECETFSRKYEPALRDTQEELAELQKDTERLIALNDGLRDDVVTRDQRINSLERDTEVLRSQIGELKSQNELLKRYKNVPRSQLVDIVVQEPALEFLSRPNNNRSVSMTSQTSLADELGLDSDHSDRSSVDEDLVPEQVDFDFSQVTYIIDDAPYQPDKPNLTVAVGDAVVTTPRIRQDSLQEHSPINLVSSVGSPHRLQPPLGMSECTVADLAPIQPVNQALILSLTTVEGVSPVQPRAASLAISNISSVDSGPIETTPVPQRLTMHIFKQSVVQIDPESGRVRVTDSHADRLKYGRMGRRDIDTLLGQALSVHQHRAALTSQRRSPLELYPASSGQWPIGDESADQHETSVATQTTCSYDDSSTLVGDSSSSIAETPDLISIPHISGSDSSTQTFMFTFLLLLAIFSKSLLPVLGLILAILSTSLQLYSLISTPAFTVSKRRISPTIHYVLHAVMAFLCWRYWSQVQAWEQVNGVGFGEGYGGAFDSFGPYGNGHRLLSILPYNWISADSPLSTKAVGVFTSTVSAFEGLIGLAPTPSF